MLWALLRAEGSFVGGAHHRPGDPGFLGNFEAFDFGSLRCDRARFYECPGFGSCCRLSGTSPYVLSGRCYHCSAFRNIVLDEPVGRAPGEEEHRCIELGRHSPPCRHRHRKSVLLADKTPRGSATFYLALARSEPSKQDRANNDFGHSTNEVPTHSSSALLSKLGRA